MQFNSDKNQEIPLCVPEIRGNEWKYVEECLNTGWVSSVGQYVNQFERMIRNYVGTKYAIATVNGTAALHISLLLAGVKPEDEVLVSSLTFIAPVNVIRYVGAWPVFIDAEPEYWQMDAQKVAEFLDQQCRWSKGELYNKATGRRVKCILPVHILGHPVDVDPIIELAHHYNLTVVEDATESLGARYKGNMVGHLGDIACLSFNGNKLLTTGGGGMILTDNEAWATKAKYLTTQAKDDPVEFIHYEIGYNYRLTNLQAAMGCAQLELIDKFIEAKRLIAATYSKCLSRVPGIAPMVEAPWAMSIFWMYTILVDAEEYGLDSRSLLLRLNQEKIQARPLWQPINQSPAHSDFQTFECGIANQLNQNSLSLPCSTGLTQDQQNKVIEVISNI
jgi:perosamine synthetase